MVFIQSGWKAAGSGGLLGFWDGLNVSDFSAASAFFLGVDAALLSVSTLGRLSVLSSHTLGVFARQAVSRQK